MERAQVHAWLRGILAINLAPFDAQDALDIGAIETNVEFMLDGGIRAIVPGGNTGEFYALAPGECRELIQRTAAVVQGRDAVIVPGVGHDARTAGRAAVEAAEVGAVAVMVHQPPHPHITQEGLLRYYEQVADASPVPIVPYISRPILTPDGIGALLERVQPAGIKYAVNDLQAFAHAVDADPDGAAVWVCGSAERWAPFFWPAGAEGFTSGLVNVTTELPLALLAALQAGDRAAVRRLWSQMEPFEALRARHGDGYNVAVVKEAVAQLGRPAGGVRPPASPVGDDERQSISRLLRGWGLV